MLKHYLLFDMNVFLTVWELVYIPQLSRIIFCDMMMLITELRRSGSRKIREAKQTMLPSKSLKSIWSQSGVV